MAIFKRSVAIAAGAVEVNLLAGSKFEFLSRPSVVTVFATESVANEILLDLTLGNVVVAEDVAPNADAGGLIQRDRDGIGSGVGAPGDRIQLRARNTNAGAPSTINVLVEINELA